MPIVRVLMGVVIVALGSARATPSVAAASACAAGITLTVQPGVVGAPGAGRPAVARDIPRGPFNVAVPLYPGATRLSHIVGNPVADYPENPYLQMAVAEYQSPASSDALMQWYRSAFTSCGWKLSGSMTTNSNVLVTGTSFTAADNHNLTVEVSFGLAPSGNTYIAYAVEAITYPPRPSRSYLHGPFTRVQIALQHNSPQDVRKHYVSHATVLDRTAIIHLVTAINAIHDYHTAPFTCFGGFIRTGPAWLTFVRPNGTRVHAFEEGPGECLGLAVNGTRWLIDPSTVWKLITDNARIQTGRG